MLDVGHAAVAEFQGVSVTYFSQLVARRERSVNEVDKLSTDVGFDVFVIWWIEPYNISSSLALLRWWTLWWRLILQSVGVPAFS